MEEKVFVEHPPMDNKPKKKLKHKWLIVLCVAAVVVAAIGFAIGYTVSEAILKGI